MNRDTWNNQMGSAATAHDSVAHHRQFQMQFQRMDKTT